jgi:type VI secretion system protein ImpF
MMAGPSKTDRLSPPLMYAFRGAFAARDSKKKLDLRDESGDRVIASRRSAARGAITEPLLRREVSIDLSTLMNTISLDSSFDIEDYDFVRKSVLNYGFPDLVHRTIDESSVNSVKDEIRTVLMQFEPRLGRESLHVARDETVDKAELKVRFVVNADLACDPLNVPVEFVAEVELDSGKILINRL